MECRQTLMLIRIYAEQFYLIIVTPKVKIGSRSEVRVGLSQIERRTP